MDKIFHDNTAENLEWSCDGIKKKSIKQMATRESQHVALGQIK